MGLDPATDYVRMFNAFFTKGDMNATYKAVFLRSLLDLGRHGTGGPVGNLPGKEWVWVDGDTVTLDLNFVAARFIKHYWDRDHALPLRQGKNRGVATIVRLVHECRRAGGIDRPPTLEDLVSGTYRRLRQSTITDVLKKHAMDRLPNDMPRLYVQATASNQIRLAADIIPFFRQHMATIQSGLDFKIAAHVERLNPEVSRPAIWPAGAGASWCAPHPEAWQFMDGEQRQRCFYCDKTRGEGNVPGIDRVMPDTYAFSADMHNRVVSCAACGLKKRGRLPAAEHFLAVLDRNDGLEGRLARLPAGVRQSFEGYDGVWYRKAYTACLIEHRGDAGFFRP